MRAANIWLPRCEILLWMLRNIWMKGADPRQPHTESGAAFRERTRPKGRHGPQHRQHFGFSCL